MTAQHTPGPWEVCNGCNVFAPAAHEPLTNMAYIACTGGLSGTDTIERDAANARLIAAAPDLLAACQAVLDEFPAADGKRIESIKRIARAAIAKATGQ